MRHDKTGALRMTVQVNIEHVNVLLKHDAGNGLTTLDRHASIGHVKHPDLYFGRYVAIHQVMDDEEILGRGIVREHGGTPSSGNAQGDPRVHRCGRQRFHRQGSVYTRIKSVRQSTQFGRNFGQLRQQSTLYNHIHLVKRFAVPWMMGRWCGHWWRYNGRWIMFCGCPSIGCKGQRITIGHAFLNLLQLLVVHVLSLHRTNVVMVQHHLLRRQSFSAVLAFKHTLRLLFQAVLGRLHVRGQTLLRGKCLVTLRTLDALVLPISNRRRNGRVHDVMSGSGSITMGLDVDMTMVDFLKHTLFTLHQVLVQETRCHTPVTAQTNQERKS